MVVLLALIGIPRTFQIRNVSRGNFNCVYLRTIILEMQTSKKSRQIYHNLELRMSFVWNFSKKNLNGKTKIRLKSICFMTLPVLFILGIGIFALFKLDIFTTEEAEVFCCCCCCCWCCCCWPLFPRSRVMHWMPVNGPMLMMLGMSRVIGETGGVVSSMWHIVTTSDVSMDPK